MERVVENRQARSIDGNLADDEAGEMHRPVGPRPRMQRISTEVKSLVSFGTTEGLARVLNWSVMLALPLLLASSDEYGVVGILVSIEIIAANVLVMGQDRAVLRFYVGAEHRRPFLGASLRIIGALSWVPIPLATLGWSVGIKTLFGVPVFPHLFLLGFNIFVLNLTIVCGCVARAENDPRAFFRFRVAYGALKLVSVVAVASVFHRSIGYVVGVAGASLLMLTLVVPYLRQRAAFAPNRRLTKDALTFGAPLVFHILSGLMLGHFSRFFLQSQASVNAVGVFTLAFTLGNGLFVIYAALATFFEPRIYGMAEDSVRSERWLSYFTNTAMGLVASCAIVLLGVLPYLMLYLPKGYESATSLIPIFIATVLAQAIYLQGNYRLAIYRKTAHIAAATFVAGGVNVCLNVLWVPTHGIWGAALAMYTATVVQAGYVMAVSLGDSLPSWRRASGPFTLSACLVGSAWTASSTGTAGAIPSLGFVAVVASVQGIRALSKMKSSPQ